MKDTSLHLPMEALLAQLITTGDKVTRAIQLLQSLNDKKPPDNMIIEISTTGRRSERVLLELSFTPASSGH